MSGAWGQYLLRPNFTQMLKSAISDAQEKGLATVFGYWVNDHRDTVWRNLTMRKVLSIERNHLFKTTMPL